MHVIAKDFNFCFGHRVWSQTLNGEFADDLKCACRHLHGHEGKVTVHMTAPQLRAGMVTDFRHTEWLKKFLDRHLDHRFVVDRNDPLFGMLTHNCPLKPVTLPTQGYDMVVGNELDYQCEATNANPAMAEYFESFFIVDFVPTSENFTEWLFDIVAEKMAPLGVEIERIEWWESPKSRSVFIGDH